MMPLSMRMKLYVGEAFVELFEEGKIKREEIFVMSKLFKGGSSK